MIEKILGFFKKSKKTEEIAESKESNEYYSRFFKPSDTRQQALERALQMNIQREFPMPKSMKGATGDSSFGLPAQFFGGVGLPPGMMDWYSVNTFIGYQACAILSQQWLVMKACTTPGKDAVRNGWTITFDEGIDVSNEEIAEIKHFDCSFKLSNNLSEYSKFINIFGIRLLYFIIDSEDPLYYEKPFNLDGITTGSYKGISQVDPYWCAPILGAEASQDPSAMYFYEPTYWQIAGKKIHRSHILLGRGPEVPDILKPTYFYGGLSLVQRIYDRVYGAERTASEALALTITKRSAVLKTDCSQVVQNQQAFEEAQRLSMIYRDNYAIRVINMDEEMTQLDTTLGDLDAVMMSQYQLVAAVANMPATKLLGTSPKGFGASGEYEEAVYHQELHSLRIDTFNPVLIRHYDLLIRSEFPDLLGKRYEIVWSQLDEPTMKEMAEINMTKADTAVKLASVGSIDGNDDRDRLIQDPMSGYPTLKKKDMSDVLSDNDLSNMFGKDNKKEKF